MARYVTRVRTDRPVEEVFALLADMRTFADWDPGVRRVVQVEGDGAGPDAEFDVTVAGFGYDPTLRYRTMAYDAPRSVWLLASTPLFTSDDHITVEERDGATVVTYDADLRLNRLIGLADPLLRPVFRRIGDRAADGLRQLLAGTFVHP